MVHRRVEFQQRGTKAEQSEIKILNFHSIYPRSRATVLKSETPTPPVSPVSILLPTDFPLILLSFTDSPSSPYLVQPNSLLPFSSSWCSSTVHATRLLVLHSIFRVRLRVSFLSTRVRVALRSSPCVLDFNRWRSKLDELRKIGGRTGQNYYFHFWDYTEKTCIVLYCNLLFR